MEVLTEKNPISALKTSAAARGSNNCNICPVGS